MQRYTEDDLTELHNIMDTEYNLLYKKLLTSSYEPLNLVAFSSVYRSLSIYNLQNESNAINFNMYKYKPIFNINVDFWKYCSPYNSFFTILPFVRGKFFPFSSYNYNKFNNSSQGTRKFMLKHNCLIVVYLTENYEPETNTYNYFINVFANREKLRELIMKPDYKLEIILDISKQQNLNELEQSLNMVISDLISRSISKCENLYITDLGELDDLSFNLYNYQKRNIMWMNSIENRDNTLVYSIKHIHPLFCDTSDYYQVYKRMIVNNFQLPNVSERKQLQFKGGVLMDEMGLGKTITCLSFIYLKSKHSYNTDSKPNLNLEYCNYKYKRGNLKNQFCSKNVFGNTLFCKSHKDTFPNVLRYETENDVSIVCSDSNKIQTNASLLICPSHLCDQWMEEIVSKFRGKLNAIMISTIDHLYNVTMKDIVLADVLILSSNFLKNPSYIKFCENNINLTNLLALKSDCHIPLHNFMWERIILDEAHELINDDLSFKSIQKFKSKFRWILSGTPFANGTKDLFNIISFITDKKDDGLTRKLPLSISGGYSYDTLNSYGLSSLEFIRSIKDFFRRNLKCEIDTEFHKNILNENEKFLTFTQDERNIYESYVSGQSEPVNPTNSTFLLQLCCDPELYEDTKDLVKNCKSLKEVQEIILRYNETKLNEYKLEIRNYQSKLQIIENELKCVDVGNSDNNDHIKDLRKSSSILKRNIERIEKIVDSYQRTYNYLSNTVLDIQNKLIQNKQYNCPICLDDIDNENLGLTKCGHKFCWSCIEELFVNNKVDNSCIKCPTCCLVLNSSEIFKLKVDDDIDNNIISELDKYIQDVKSTKIGNIIHFLKSELNESDKCIIFSQWDTLLRKVQSKISQFKVKSVNCVGTVYQKRKAVSQFIKDKDTKLIFLSSQNSASGLNLMCANKIIFIEPIYGTETYKRDTENQAIGRADRIGQNLPIDIYRFIIKDTIEETIHRRCGM